jgi:tape measure domain-containing protein
MQTVGYATLQIIPSMRGVRAQLQGEADKEIGPAVEAAGDKAGDRGAKATSKSFLAGIGGLGKKIATGIGIGLGVAGAAAATWGVKTAAANEQATVAFEGMLGSAEKAQSFLTELRDFAAKTPFELPGLQDASRQLLGVGFATDEVLPTLGKIGDVAAALGVGEDGVNSVIRALGQMKGKGKASAEELQQISEAVPGFSAIGAIASTMGISTAAAFDQMSKGAIPAQTAIDAVLSGMEKFPGAAGAMERQSLTLNGMLSTLKDTLGQGLAAVMTPVVEGLKSSMPQLTETISGLMTNLGPVIADSLGGFLEMVGTLLPAIAPVLSTMGSLFVSVLNQLRPVIEALTPIIAKVAEVLGNALNGALDQIIPPLGDLLVSLSPLLPIIAQVAATIIQALAPVIASLATALVPVVSALLDGFMPALDQVLPMLPQLAAAFLPLIPPLGRLLVALAPLITLFASLVSQGLAALLPALIPIIEKVATFAGELIDKVIPAVTSVVEWITKFTDVLTAGDWSKAGEMLSGLWDTIKAGAGDLWDKLIAGLQEALPRIGTWLKDTALPTVVAKLGEWGGAFAAWVPGAVTGLLGKLGELLASLGVWIAETALPTIIEKLLNWGLAFTGWIVQTAIDLPFKLIQLALALGAWIRDAVPGIVEKVKEWVPAILGWVATAIVDLPGKLGELATKLLDWIGGLPTQITDKAKGMFSGIANAFIAAINWIIRTWNGLSLQLPEIDTHIPGIGKVGGFTLDTPDFPEIPSFHTGGVVPGRGGQDVLAMLQAGEVVVPRSGVAAGGAAGLGQVVQNFHGRDTRKLARDSVFELKAAGMLAVTA